MANGLEMVITNDGVELREVFVKRQVGLQGFMESLRNQFVASTPILPREVVAYFRKKEVQMFLIEEEPATRDVVIKAGINGSKAKKYKRKLDFPWVYHLAEFFNQALERIFVFCSPKQILSLDQTPYHLPLPNIGDGTVLCTGNSLSLRLTGTIHSKTKSILNAFWMSEFNFDLIDSYVQMPKEIIEATNAILANDEKIKPREDRAGSYFLGWETLSAKEGLDICKLKWIPLKESLAQMVERQSSRRG